MIPQCATCINEPAVIDVLHSVWRGMDQEQWNTAYLRYQDAARKSKCQDYMKVWVM